MNKRQKEQQSVASILGVSPEQLQPRTFRCGRKKRKIWLALPGARLGRLWYPRSM